MSKYLVRSGIRGMFKVDQENLDVVDYIRTNIDWIYQADDDGVVTYKGKDGDYSVEVKKDDLIIQFYNVDGFQHPLVVISNKEWLENIKGEKEFNEKRHEDCDINECCKCANCEAA